MANIELYIIFDPDSGLYYKGAKDGKPVWSKKPKYYNNLAHLQASLKQCRNHITGRMIIKTCDLHVCDERSVVQKDIGGKR